MSRIRLKQILSNLSYDKENAQLILSGSNDPSFIVSGSILIVPTPNITGSLTIQDIDNFGDSGSFTTIDLGQY